MFVLFLAFSDLTHKLQFTGVGAFWLHCVCRLIVRRPNLEVVTKRLLHQQIRIPGNCLLEVALALRQLNPIHKKGSIKCFFLKFFKFLVVSIFPRSVGVIYY